MLSDMLLFESSKINKQTKQKCLTEEKKKKYPMLFTKPHNEETLFKTKEVQKINLKQSCKIPVAHSPEASFIFTPFHYH